MNDKHPRVFVWTAIGLVVLAGCHSFLTLALYPTAVYWMTYYVPNYAFGFLRRGLGGEIIRMLPDAAYFLPFTRWCGHPSSCGWPRSQR